MVAGRMFLGVEHRLLGRTGLRVSPLCLGTMNFGDQAEEAEGHRIMDRAQLHEDVAAAGGPGISVGLGEIAVAELGRHCVDVSRIRTHPCRRRI